MAGRLDTRVTIQSETETEDDHHEPIKVWSDLAEVWAWVQPLSGREFFEGQESRGEVSHRITIRYSRDVMEVDRTHRIRFGSPLRTLDVQAVINRNEANRWLELMCLERTP